jgi:hypothetical protein
MTEKSKTMSHYCKKAVFRIRQYFLRIQTADPYSGIMDLDPGSQLIANPDLVWNFSGSLEKNVIEEVPYH